VRDHDRHEKPEGRDESKTSEDHGYKPEVRVRMARGSPSGEKEVQSKREINSIPHVRLRPPLEIEGLYVWKKEGGRAQQLFSLKNGDLGGAEQRSGFLS